MDLGKIGYRVGIDDAEYYRKLKAVETSTDKSTERIGGMFSRLAGALGLLAAAWAGWTEARRYASELANIKSIAAELDLSKLRKDISSLDAVLGKSSEIANGVYFAYSAGVRGTEKELVDFTAEIAKLAKTIGGGVTPVMDAATTMMNAYGLTVKDTGKLTDWFYQIVKSGKTTGPELAQSLGQIAATAAASGVSLEQLGAAMATLTTTMPTNIAVTSLAASLRALMNPTDETATLAKELGIQMDAAALKTKGLGGVMDEIYRKTGGNGDLIAKLFPAESSRAVIALAGTQLGTFKTNIVDFSNNAGAAAAGFAARVDNMDDAVNSLGVVMLKVAESVGKFTYEVLTLGGVLKPMIGWIANMKSETIDHVAKILFWTAALGLLNKALGFIGMGTRINEQKTLNAETAEHASKINAVNREIASQNALLSQNRTLQNDPFRRENIQQRWDDRKVRNAARKAERLNQSVYDDQELALSARMFGGGASVSGNMSKSAMPEAASFRKSLSEIGATAASTTPNLKKIGISIDDISKKLPLSARAMMAVGQAAGGLRSAATSVLSALTGGQRGLSGAISSIGNAALVASAAFAGWELGKWVGEILNLKDRFGKWFFGQDFAAHDAENEKYQADRQSRQKREEEKAKEVAAKTALSIKQAEAEKQIYEARRQAEYDNADPSKRISMLRADMKNTAWTAGYAADEDKRRDAKLKLIELEQQLRKEIIASREAEKARIESKLDTEYESLKNDLSGDGEISKRDELTLLDKEIENQKKRRNLAVNDAKTALRENGENSNQYLSALTEQERAQGRLYELERKRVEQSREYAREQDEIARSIAFAELTAKAWQDGQLTHAEKVKLAEQSIADQKARVLQYQNELDAAASEDERNAARKALADAQITLGQLLGDQRNLQGNGMAAGSFSTEVLNGLLGANDTEKQIAGDVRTIAREFNRYRNGRTNEIKGLGE